ncbi:MAG: SET domain-containing protein [Pseudomonadota bacterium]
MTISQTDSLGLISAVLQMAGYAIYIRNFERDAIKPNAASFFMFAYGTSLLAFLEWKSGASFALLALPFTCAALGVVVALMCLRAGATEPIDRFEARAFWTDVWLTGFYMFFALGLGDAERFVVPFLVVTNLSAIVCFVPILRSTWSCPERELPGAWIIWTAAYAMLALATVESNGFSNPVLLLYPLLNMALHLAMLALTLRKPIASMLFNLSQGRLRIARSDIDGFGLFAKHGFAANEDICQLRGVLKRRPTRTLPNWIGIGPGLWIVPGLPLQHINHSCRPNAAFGRNRRLHTLREISAGEEITLDYSTTEADPQWSMACSCHSDNCRQKLFAIQHSFVGDAPPPASPLMQRIWYKLRFDASTETTAFVQLTEDTSEAEKPMISTQ